MIKLRNTGTVTLNTGEIAASGNYTSDAFDASGLQGYFSLQWITTGDGTCKIEVLPSNDGENFPDIEDDIATGQTKTTGPASDGKNMASFEVSPCNFIKLKITETAGAVNTVTLALRLRVF